MELRVDQIKMAKQCKANLLSIKAILEPKITPAMAGKVSEIFSKVESMDDAWFYSHANILFCVDLGNYQDCQFAFQKIWKLGL